MLLSDIRIAEYAAAGMIAPFVPDQVREITVAAGHAYRAISFGTSCYGYDLRVSDQDIWVSRPKRRIDRTSPLVIDPKHFDVERWLVQPRIHESPEGRFFRIPPRGVCLCRSLEYLSLPDHITGLVFGKSTLGRTFLHGFMTPAEAGWEGHYVFEFYNPWPFPYTVYVEEGIAQILFLEGHPAKTPYGARTNPKYQGQIFSGPKV